MQQIAEFRRPAFLNDHPPVTRTKLFAADENETEYLAGSVLGADEDGKVGMWTESSASVVGILAEDVVAAADKDVAATVYIHADVVPQALVWDESVTDDVKSSTAIPALRAAGIYA